VFPIQHEPETGLRGELEFLSRRQKVSRAGSHSEREDPDPWVRRNPEGKFGLRRRRQAVQAPLAPAEAFTRRV